LAELTESHSYILWNCLIEK